MGEAPFKQPLKSLKNRISMGQAAVESALLSSAPMTECKASSAIPSASRMEAIFLLPLPPPPLPPGEESMRYTAMLWKPSEKSCCDDDEETAPRPSRRGVLLVDGEGSVAARSHSCIGGILPCAASFYVHRILISFVLAVSRVGAVTHVLWFYFCQRFWEPTVRWILHCVVLHSTSVRRIRTSHNESCLDCCFVMACCHE
jgi:hypothetical protein